jgi:hypothetical protein
LGIVGGAMREQCERPQRDIIMVACHYCSICSRLTGGDMAAVVHFEMSCDDRDRMARVYQAVFKWDTAGLGADMGRYVLAATTESDCARSKRPGAINGDSCKDNVD